jgi:hypothetical protein
MRFDFVFMDCGPAIGWRIYIINNIDYKGRDSSSQATHWLHDDGETFKYICWAGRISTLEQAKTVAALWADTIMLYIRTGESFDKIVKRL